LRFIPASLICRWNSLTAGVLIPEQKAEPEDPKQLEPHGSLAPELGKKKARQARSSEVMKERKAVNAVLQLLQRGFYEPKCGHDVSCPYEGKETKGAR
jgi:hypothetical protein